MLTPPILVAALVVGDCTQWLPPKNIADYPKWHYCNRRPGDGQTEYEYIANQLPPADVAPYQCTGGRVLRHDAHGIICADYTQGDEYAGPCTDAQCCAEGICSGYTCTNGGVLRDGAEDISCSYFPCNDYTCCEDPPGSPVNDAQGLVFVDRDPGRFQFGGQATIIKAADESDVTHYRVYWGFAKTVRKVPSCGLYNPISWEQFKFTDLDRMYVEIPATGCDPAFDVPMGTLPDVRCPISTDRQDKGTNANDPCNPHYFVVATVNSYGMKSIGGQVQQLGPRHPISDFEGEFGLPCAEGGVTMGHDLPGPDDVILGAWNGVETAKDCAKLCRDYVGSKGPCRYWTWAYPTSGHTAKSCWMEAQVMQKAHYGVRVIGPAVCPTAEDATPRGVERPRCDRWVRVPNMAPFDDQNRNAFFDKGGIYAQKPNFPDVPLGQYDTAEHCQALCDMDVLCVGFVFMKKDVTDTYFHRCFLVHIFEMMMPSPYYDTWMCSREGMSPLVNGYDLQSHPFGYKTCDGVTIGTRDPTIDIDCCAVKCEEANGCTSFTYFNTDKTCQLYSSCGSMSGVDKVEGCAYESCFSDYGGATYTKQNNFMQIVDKWPVSGGSAAGGMPTHVQTSTRLDGRTILCAAGLVADTGGMPNTAEEMNLLDAGKRFSGVVVDGVAVMLVTGDYLGGMVVDAVQYEVRCGVENAPSMSLPGYVSLAVTTEYPEGYNEVTANNGDPGWCRGDNGCILGSVGPNKPYTTASCKALCDAATSCLAFQIRSSDGNCGLATTCEYNTVQEDSLVRCFKKSTGRSVHDIGSAMCEGKCCRWPRRYGNYTRNFFLSRTSEPCAQTTVPTTIEPTPTPTTATAMPFTTATPSTTAPTPNTTAEPVSSGGSTNAPKTTSQPVPSSTPAPTGQPVSTTPTPTPTQDETTLQPVVSSTTPSPTPEPVTTTPNEVPMSTPITEGDTEEDDMIWVYIAGGVGGVLCMVGVGVTWWMSRRRQGPTFGDGTENAFDLDDDVYSLQEEKLIRGEEEEEVVGENFMI